MILLTDEEKALAVYVAKEQAGQGKMEDYSTIIAKAQLKKVYEWGEGYCMEHPGSLRRHSCYQCWQALLKEIS